MSDARDKPLKEIYQRAMEEHPRWYGEVPPDSPELLFIRAHLPEDRGCRILDAGCGNGRYSIALSQLGYRDIVGVDICDPINTGGKFEYLQASLEKIPLPDASVDFICSMSVIYHLKDPADAIREFARVLKPGGRAVITVHARFSVFTAYNLHRARRGKPDAVHLVGARFLSPFQYRRILARNGMRILSLDGYRLSFLYHYLYRPIVYKVKKETGVQLPLAAGGLTSNPALRWLKSVFAYHTVIIAEK